MKNSKVFDILDDLSFELTGEKREAVLAAREAIREAGYRKSKVYAISEEVIKDFCNDAIRSGRVPTYGEIENLVGDREIGVLEHCQDDGDRLREAYNLEQLEKGESANA